MKNIKATVFTGLLAIAGFASHAATISTDSQLASYTQVKTAGLNINKADASDLMELPGIGPKKAEAIIDFRQQHGDFVNIEDLMLVKGIGERVFEKLSDKISVN